MVKLRSQQLKNGQYSLYLDIYKNGKRIREYLELYVSKDYTSQERVKNIAERDKETFNTALEITSKRAIELSSQDFGIIPQFKKNSDFLLYFKQVMDKKGNQTYQGAYKHLKDFAGTRLSFRSVNEVWIAEFKSYLLQRMTPNTAFIYLQRLSIALNEAVKEGLISVNPSKKISLPKKTEPDRTFLTLEELQQLFNTPTSFKNNVQTRQAFLFSCFTGLRFSDIKKLTWNEINNYTQLKFRPKKTSTKVHYLPFSPQATEILKEILPLAGNDLVFYHLPPHRTVCHQMKQWQKKAGLQKNLHFHVGRHTFATLALTHGVDLYTVSKLLCHSNISTTQVYAKIIDQKKDEAVRKLPTLF